MQSSSARTRPGRGWSRRLDGRLRRHLLAALALALGFVPAAGAAAVLSMASAAGALAAPCQPHISHVSKFPPGKVADVTITGTCFGTGGAFTNGNSDHFRVTDLGPKGTVTELENAGKIPQTWWNACAGTTDAINGNSPNVVTCNVPAWTNTSVTFRSFGPAYGEYREGAGDEELNWVVDAGDKIVVQVWNANVPTSADWCLVTVAGSSAPGTGTTCSAVLVAGNPVTSGGGGGAASTGTEHYGPGNTLLPSPLGEGQCEYQEFVDSSYQAQIAVYEANCTQADAVGTGAFQSRGSAYHADGFACAAKAEGAGSEWASAWTGTYYAYDCKAGAAQVAFNWGPHYSL